VVQSKAPTPEEYLAELPEDRREVVAAVRQVILDNLPEGYQESMTWGMPSYEIPLSRYPTTYNGKPLAYAALAAQKNYFSLYLMSVCADSEEETSLRDDFEAAGKRLDMGKSCIRFKKLDDLPLDVIAKAIAATPVDAYIERYEAARGKK
jgi:uncharacterized protein YdhG (YjbR/CyaY superfamily)